MKKCKELFLSCPAAVLGALFSLGLYAGTAAPDPLHALGTGLLTFLVLLMAEKAAPVRLRDALSPAGVLFLGGEVLLFALLAVLFPGVGCRQGCISLVIFILCLTAFLFYARSHGLGRSPVPGLLLLSCCTAGLYFFVFLGAFTADSYTYAEIARSFLRDYGRVPTIRQYVVVSGYSCSFPYLYPLLIRLTDALTGFGLYSGWFLNLLLTAVSCAELLRVSLLAADSTRPGMIACALLLFNPYYMAEAAAARAIPAALLLMLLAIECLLRISLKGSDALSLSLLAGLASGGAAAVRFDALPWLVMAGAAMLLFHRRRRFAHAAVFALSALVMLAPWILYSLVRFGTLWISDNNGTFLLVTPMVPNRVVLAGDGIPTLLNAPGLWARALLRKAVEILTSVVRCAPSALPVILLVPTAVILPTVKRSGLPAGARELLPTAGFILLYCLGKTAMYILVGYADARYHIESTVLVTLLVLALAERTVPGKTGRNLLIPVLCLIAAVGVYQNRYSLADILPEADRLPLKAVVRTPEPVEELDRELESAGVTRSAELMVMGDAFAFGCWSGRNVLVPPANPSADTIRYVLDTYARGEPLVVFPKENVERRFLPVLEELRRLPIPCIETEHYRLFFWENR